MPILRDFERRLGNLVEGFFATAFRSGLQPVELAKRILREMDAGKTVGVRGVWAPNHFVFTLSAEDAERFQQVEGALVGELKQVVREAAAERGWGLVGPPEIEFRTNDSMGKGQFDCEATLVEGEPEPAPAASATGGGAVVVLLEEGDRSRTYPLDKQTMAIGRLPECDIVISDPGASRRHATITREDTGEFVLRDQASTNGTIVNDDPIGEHVLSDGDRITIGNTILEFRRE